MNEPIRNRFKRFIHKYLEENVDDEAKLTLHSLRQYYVDLAETEKSCKLSNQTRIRHFQERQGFQDARRGVDGPRSNVVIDYDFPFDADTYSHLVGRADYVETKGLSISFVFNDDNKAVLKNVRIDLRSRMPIELDVADYMNVV
ncbi:Suppressor of the cold-sensitive snRNP biogenesis mutant brr1-1 [Haplosporangium bisporale]|nr:Suppressor of the cold-sensitive snRNP biogenesis mutant brr1-1 [Haplosporangium bisporale]KAF9215145.1 Suppressor of the cold-sensitive snRNP biogenesis mutant brr1-1 [Podila verticillata]